MDRADFIKLKYGDLAAGGWSPRLRERFGYLTPDDRYEMMVSQYVTSETDWLDVGCGRMLFGSNRELSAMLAARCRSLTGIDPSPNILENPLLHHREQCLIEDFDPGRQFDLVTMRMVVEHMDDPPRVCAALARLVRPGGHVMVYTVNKWSPVTVLSAWTPLSVHHVAKRILWEADEKDTFPVVYKMNTRAELERLFREGGFAETAFENLADARTLARFRPTALLELGLWRALRMIGIVYPENCLLGVYTRRDR